ncbi:MAG: N-acetyltransferase [Dysgonamonadaceae bacterium]|jgi:predicted GNAT family acetyltransferase|nr:N-acetyltransferase [Dysgonamonadaceae bacterium]
MTKIEREDNGKNGRFAIYEDSSYAGEMTYVWAGNTRIIIDHTGVEDEYNGKGYGKLLVMAAVDFARADKVKILPLCPFAKLIFDRNKDIQDVRL